ncbi:unnamed protein product, partial [Rotaria magnacalcarata]
SLINDHIDVSNTVQLLASGIGTELEKVSVKASTRKKKKKGTAYTIVIEEESTPCCFESLKNPALLKYKNQITEATAEDLELVRFIDKGNFGSVDHVRINNDSDFQIAVKRISLSTNEERACVTKAELTVMQDICTGHCPYLIEYYGAMIDTITSALEFLAVKDYLHRDIKPDNILVNDSGVFKLNDYGTCCRMNSTENVPIGTIAYFPPEVVRNPPAPSSTQSDMWALGISVVETILGQHPCPISNDIDRALLLTKWNRDILEGMIFDDIRKLILQLLKTEPEERPGSYTEILQMSFIQTVRMKPTFEENLFIFNIIQIIRHSENGN